MSATITYSRASIGIDAPLVTVETHFAKGLPGTYLVGLAETAVKESKFRIQSACTNCQFEWPVKKIIINLAPADLPKEGSRFDLAIAIGILHRSGQLDHPQLERYEFYAELALNGGLRPVGGILAAAMRCKQRGKTLVIAEQNAAEASQVSDLALLVCNDLLSLCAHLMGKKTIPTYVAPKLVNEAHNYPDLADVRGQPQAKRCIELAAAGNHSLLLEGPPGSGKTLLANCLAGILPALSQKHWLETQLIYSVGKQRYLPPGRVPFRAPHHSASSVALVGGGNPPKPGEISLAHHGVLFLDELPEFSRQVIETLREPLESHQIAIARASRQVTFPAKFLLLAAMNPCPCGYFGDSSSRCNCSHEQIRRYRSKLSGPFLDRIDLHLRVDALPARLILQSKQQHEESSRQVATRVTQARQVQYQRQNCLNNQLNSKQLEQCATLDKASKTFLLEAAEKFQLSARACHRSIKVARTIADLANCPQIEKSHMQESLLYRNIWQGGLAK